MSHSAPAEPEAYAFSARERARLEIYRAAVQAKFFTDQIDEPDVHFSESELTRLFTYHPAVESGFFNEDE